MVYLALAYSENYCIARYSNGSHCIVLLNFVYALFTEITSGRFPGSSPAAARSNTTRTPHVHDQASDAEAM